MSRPAGKKRKPARVQIYYFKKNERGEPLVEPSLSTSLVGAVPSEPELPTEPFYVPDFLAQFQAKEDSKTSSPARRPKRSKRRGSSGRGVRSPSGVSRMGKDEAKARIKQGRELFRQGRLAEARHAFEAVVASGAPDAYAHRMLGTLYLSLGDRTRSLALFDAALRLDGSDVPARVYRGEIQLGRGLIDEALTDLSTAVRVGKPEDPFVRRASQLLTRVQSSL
jgi:tetratricopeptide (TPR) repeat protein